MHRASFGFGPRGPKGQGKRAPFPYHLHNFNLNHVSAFHVTSSRLSLGLRVYSNSSLPLFFDPVSLLMACQQPVHFDFEL